MVDLAAAPRPAAPLEPSVPRRSTATTVLVASAVSWTIFLGGARSRLGAEFGDSHDGRNGSTWALAADAIADHGWLGSRGGTSHPLHVYAHHPPGMGSVAWLVRALGGPSGLVTRSPAWIGTLLALALLASLLCRLGMSPGATVAATAAVAATPMVQVYGGMLNHEALILPFTLAATRVWIDGSRHRARDLSALIIVGSLTSFHMLAFALCLIAVDIGTNTGLVARRIGLRDPAARRATGEVAVPLVIAATLVAAWLAWAGGGLDEVLAQSGNRTSAGSLNMPDVLQRQWLFLRLTVPTLTVACALGGLTDLLTRVVRRSRDHEWAAVTLAWIGYVVGYALLLPGGSSVHVFWNYAVVVPVAIGLAALVDAVTRARPSLRHLIAPAVAVALVVTGLSGTSAPEVEFRAGLDGPRALADLGPEDQADLPVWPGIAGWTWAELVTGLDVVTVTDDELAQMARVRPTTMVLVPRDGLEALRPGMSWTSIEAHAGLFVGDYALVTAETLVDITAA